MPAAMNRPEDITAELSEPGRDTGADDRPELTAAAQADPRLWLFPPDEEPLELRADSSLDVTVELEPVAGQQPSPDSWGCDTGFPAANGAPKSQPPPVRDTLSVTLLDSPPQDPETRMRFGQGVPETAAVHERQQRARREVRRRGRRRAGRRPLLRAGGWYAVALLAAGALLWHYWPRQADGLHVEDVFVVADTANPGCDGVVTVRGVIRTDGAGGKLSYRWRRSDGSGSPLLHQGVSKEQKAVSVETSWSFHGPGTMHARVLLEVVKPSGHRAGTEFTYACPGKSAKRP